VLGVDVVRHSEGGVVDPDRATLAESGRPDPPAQRGYPVEPVVDRVGELGEAEPAARVQ
jgi:hypothetical protein